MELELRPERPEDHRIVEELTRDAFWNLHVPGCDEHLLIHKLRSCPAFISALDFVALINGRIVGHIAYTRGKVIDEQNHERAVILFGPLSVLPEYQNQGVGSALIRHTLHLAQKMGYPAVIIYGDPEYYKRFGFRPAEAYAISTPSGSYSDALLAMEIKEGALLNLSGRFHEDPIYDSLDKDELAQFDRTFPPKEKLVTESQKRFIELSQSNHL